MSKIDDIIKQHCPNGVEFRELAEVCTFKRGSTITAKDVIDGNIPVIAGGQKPAYFHNRSNREGETISVSSSGAYAGYVSYWTIPVFLSDSFSVEPNENILNKKYVFYFLKNLQKEIYATKKGGGVPHVHGSNLAKFKIPVPPMEVQEEIVRILDKFTELEAELEARKKQYKYYRDNLLKFDELVKICNIGDVCSVQSGGTPSKSKLKYWGGNIKWLGSTVCQNQKNITSITDYITEEGYNNSSAKLIRKDSTLIALVGATIGKIAFLPFEAAINQNVAAIYPNDLSQLNPSYLYYIMGTLYDKFQSLSHGKLAMANLSFIRNLKIPIPPLSEQERIVSILDKFDALVNDISEGLPAELNARRKQYEYYRDKLLTFSEK